MFSQLTALLQNASHDSDYGQWKMKLLELEKTKAKNEQLQLALSSCEGQISSMAEANVSLERRLALHQEEAEGVADKLARELEEVCGF